MTQLYLKDLRTFELESMDLDELVILEIEQPAPTPSPPRTTFSCKIGEAIEEVPWILVGERKLFYNKDGSREIGGAYLPAITNCRMLNKNRSVVGIHR